MKAFLIVVILLFTGPVFAQTNRIPEDIQSMFEGTWSYQKNIHSNTIIIKFEPGKDYAVFTDVGTAEAPARRFHAKLKGNLLIIPARREINDYIELEIIKGGLHLRSRPTVRDENGKPTNGNNIAPVETGVFKRIKKRK